MAKETTTAVPGQLARALAACRTHFIFVGCMSAAINLLYLAPTLYMLQVYDRALPANGIGTLILLSLALVGVLGVLNVFDYLRSRVLVRMSARLDHELSGPVLAKILAGRGVSQSDRVQAVRDLDAYRQSLAAGPLLAAMDAPWTPIFLIAAFAIHPMLGLAGIISGGIIFALAWLHERATGKMLATSNDAAAVTYANQDYASSAADSVRALGMSKALVAKHLAERRQMVALQTRASFRSGAVIGLIKYFRMLVQSLALGLGAYLAIKHEISGGSVIAASVLLSRILSPIEQLTSGWKAISQVRSAHSRLNKLLGSGELEEKTALPNPRGLLTLESVNIRAPRDERLLVRNVSFDVNPGEVVCLVGASGAGKTTLLRGITGAADIDSGVVRIDGASMASWDSERLSRHVGYLPQDFVLFAGTVKQNISRFCGYLGADADQVDALVVEASKAAGAHGLILTLPQGYDTRLEFNGVGLSAGQRQRIALARALFGKPSLLVLDEPNANLDNEGNFVLAQTIKQCRSEGVAILMAAHHGLILGLADRVVVMNGGAVQAIGPRDSILNLSSLPPSRRPAPAADSELKRA